MKRFSPARFDPSQNVLHLLDVATDHFHEILTLQVQRLDEQHRQHTIYTKQLTEAEKGRLDAFREMDLKTTSTALNESSSHRAALSAQILAVNEGVRGLVSSVTDNLTKQGEMRGVQLSDRISLLERSQYQAQGKSEISKSVVAFVAAVVGSALTILFQHFVTK
jgi:hypothetical protein